jgi:amino acid adenylation domain-containing protein
MTALHARLLEVLRAAPERAAIDSGRQGTTSYAGLFATAAALATRFGDRPAAIGVLSNRQAEAYCAVLAAFFARVRFVPLNPGFPVERLQAIVRLAGVDLVLTDGGNVDAARALGARFVDVTPVLAGHARQRVDAEAFDAGAADGIAYQMFTSGSTGEPKGVPIDYAALDHYVRTLRAHIDFPAAARFSQLFDLSFDLAMHDIFVALASGGTIVPASPIDLMMPHAYVNRARIDVWFSVPMLAMVAARGLGPRTPEHRLQLALFCGEQLPMDFVERFRPLVAGDAIYNLYGPTEATIAFTAKRLGPADHAHAVAPLGEPFGDNRVAVLDEHGAVVDLAEGVEGELLLGGPQVFAGYQPDRGIQCFVDGPQGRFYRSGDRVRVAGGDLHHLGRIDSQIKLRGHRIELGEIESAFREVFGCDAAAAVVVGEHDAAEIRVAYEGRNGIGDLAALKARLPDYMVPKRAMRVDALPVNVNGKVDRKAIGAMAWQSDA